MLEDVKLALRITGNAFDDELTDLIGAAKLDMQNSGVEVIDDTDPLIKRAVITYCKANFGENPNMDRFAEAYYYMKIALSLAGDYNAQ